MNNKEMAHIYGRELDKQCDDIEVVKQKESKDKWTCKLTLRWVKEITFEDCKWEKNKELDKDFGDNDKVISIMENQERDTSKDATVTKVAIQK